MAATFVPGPQHFPPALASQLAQLRQQYMSRFPMNPQFMYASNFPPIDAQLMAPAPESAPNTPPNVGDLPTLPFASAPKPIPGITQGVPKPMFVPVARPPPPQTVMCPQPTAAAKLDLMPTASAIKEAPEKPASRPRPTPAVTVAPAPVRAYAAPAQPAPQLSQLSPLTSIDDVMDILTMFDGSVMTPLVMSNDLGCGASHCSDDTQVAFSAHATDAASSHRAGSDRSNSPPVPKRRASMNTPRWSVSREQKQLLEEFFRQVPMPSRAARQALAEQMGVSCQQVKVWFRNQRQRIRLAERSANYI